MAITMAIIPISIIMHISKMVTRGIIMIAIVIEIAILHYQLP